MSSKMRFTSDHEWVELEGNIATIGITEHAAEELGDVIYVELPAVGDTFAQGDNLAVAESVKAAADIFAPIGGTVTEVNDALEDEPGLVNEDPMGNGWIVRIDVDDVTELDDLMDEEEYEEYLKEEEQ
ncbi:MAG: glycine cleavage system protein GcvH [Bacillota bacterium]|jgi:glycine cleavage system H protein|nr:glycine cleavage system protein GcvH [Bacillota bacterium]HOB42849.1 glycine cleavage system protein GcvH [Bacillota bacterium]HOK70232.1 glycine cleavage system protein GcvH [Bacillota bacterium]HOL51891.1 glycine cleavage system protein GcvH [Bacillota bacterium]HOO30405.1 glycine cleavage system protein GcvH [Bacillota bacterium]